MQQVLAVINEEFRGEVRRDELMLSHTGWRVGGPARVFLVPQDKADLQVLLHILKRFRVPWLVLGRGTSLLVKDDGFDGAVISLERFNAIEFKLLGRIDVGAGFPLAKLSSQAASNGLLGLEGFDTIPGTVGGALIKNTDNGDTEIGTLVEQLTLVDAEGEQSIECTSTTVADCCSALPEQAVIVSAVLRLERAWTEKLRQDLQNRESRKVSAVYAAAIFKNPQGTPAEELIKVAGMNGERCGYAEIPATDCNRIVNLGQATAEDVLNLIELTRKRVLEQTGTSLELNVKVAGQGMFQ